MDDDVCVVRPRVSLRRCDDAWERDGLHHLQLDADLRVHALVDRDGLMELVVAAWEGLSDADRRMIQREFNRREMVRALNGLSEIVGAPPRIDLRAVGRGV